MGRTMRRSVHKGRIERVGLPEHGDHRVPAMVICCLPMVALFTLVALRVF